ncbi:MAG: ATP-binding protein [Candidatus Kapabacteria bacterium]|nr:ATP-binding protein [Candidatus Kapabacteria bacterium]
MTVVNILIFILRRRFILKERKRLQEQINKEKWEKAYINEMNQELENSRLQLQEINERLQNEISARLATEVSLSESLGTFFTILHTSPFAIVLIMFPEGNVIESNSNFFKMFGLEKSDVPTDAFIQNLPIWKNKSDFSIIQQKIGEKSHIREYELDMQKKNSDEVNAVITAKTIDLYGKKCLVTIFQDVTEKKKEAELLRKTKEAADEASKLKGEFLANMSHEIRTPMNSILGFSELLLTRIKDETNREYVNTILTSGRNLLTLLNDILDLSKIEAGKLELQYNPANFKELLKEVKQIFIIKANEKKLDLNYFIDQSIPDYLIIDDTRLRQILLNLVGNAIKFTKNGFVHINTYPRKLSEKSLDLVIEVSDSGIGIPKEQMNVIFEAFRQQDGQSQKVYGGTGLGLTITRRLVEMMNGYITLESELNKGSTFRIFLPDIKIPDNSDLQKNVEKEQFDNFDIEFQGSTVLIVDDTDVNRQLIIEILKNYNLKLIQANNGKYAVEFTNQFKPDIVFMDIKMPVMDGYEATKIIKENPETNSIPVIALTASTMKSDEDKIQKIGFNGFIRKPLERKELFEALVKYLPHSKPEQQDISITSNDSSIINDTPFDVNNAENINLNNEIIQKLTGELLETCNKLKKSLMIGAIKKFAVEIKTIGEENNINSLISYGEQLCGFTDRLALDKIINSLDEYTQITNKLISK